MIRQAFSLVHACIMDILIRAIYMEIFQPLVFEVCMSPDDRLEARAPIPVRLRVGNDLSLFLSLLSHAHTQTLYFSLFHSHFVALT